jgi:hypothetical protein
MAAAMASGSTFELRVRLWAQPHFVSNKMFCPSSCDVDLAAATAIVAAAAATTTMVLITVASLWLHDTFRYPLLRE